MRQQKHKCWVSSWVLRPAKKNRKAQRRIHTFTRQLTGDIGTTKTLWIQQLCQVFFTFFLIPLFFNYLHKGRDQRRNKDQKVGFYFDISCPLFCTKKEKFYFYYTTIIYMHMYIWECWVIQSHHHQCAVVCLPWLLLLHQPLVFFTHSVFMKSLHCQQSTHSTLTTKISSNSTS